MKARVKPQKQGLMGCGWHHQCEWKARLKLLCLCSSRRHDLSHTHTIREGNVSGVHTHLRSCDALRFKMNGSQWDANSRSSATTADVNICNKTEKYFSNWILILLQSNTHTHTLALLQVHYQNTENTLFWMQHTALHTHTHTHVISAPIPLNNHLVFLWTFRDGYEILINLLLMRMCVCVCVCVGSSDLLSRVSDVTHSSVNY